jgi:hypothetical protein
MVDNDAAAGMLGLCEAWKLARCPFFQVDNDRQRVELVNTEQLLPPLNSWFAALAGISVNHQHPKAFSTTGVAP